MLKSTEECLADLGARLELRLSELCELRRLRPYREDCLHAVDPDHLVSADGWQALVEEEGEYGVVLWPGETISTHMVVVRSLGLE